MIQVSWFKYRICIVLDFFMSSVLDRIAGFTGSPAAGSPAAGFLFKDSFLIPITIHTMTASALAACSAKCMV